MKEKNIFLNSDTRLEKLTQILQDLRVQARDEEDFTIAKQMKSQIQIYEKSIESYENILNIINK